MSNIAGERSSRPDGVGHQAVRAAASAWVAHFAGLLVGISLTPVLIRQLGANGYGTWAVCLGVVAYLGLLDLGVGTAVAVNGARLLGARREGAVANMFRAARRFYLALAVTTAACGIGLAWWVSRTVSGTTWPGEVSSVCLILGFGQVAIFVSTPFSSMAAAAGRPYVQNIGRTIGTVAYGLGGAGALMYGWGVRGVALSWALGNAFAGAYVVHRARRLVSKRLPAGSDVVRLADLVRDGLPYLANSMAWQLVFATDSIVIAATIGTEAVARYMPTFRFVEAIGYASLLPLGGLLPLMGAIGGSGDRPRLAVLLRRSASLSLAFTLVGASLAVGLGRPVVELWVGAPYYAGNGVLFSLVCFMVVRAVSASSANVLASTGHMRYVALATLGEGALNLILSLSLVRPLGITGVATATLIAHLAVSGCILPRRASFEANIHLSQWLRPALAKGVRAALPAFLAVATLRWIWSDPGAVSLPVRLAILVAVAVVGLWTQALDQEERRTVWRALKVDTHRS